MSRTHPTSAQHKSQSTSSWVSTHPGLFFNTSYTVLWVEHLEGPPPWQAECHGVRVKVDSVTFTSYFTSILYDPSTRSVNAAGSNWCVPGYRY